MTKDVGSPTRQSFTETKPQNQPPRQASSILAEDQCLAGMSRLPGMLALNIIKPDGSNAMLGAYRAILRHHSSTKDAQCKKGRCLPTSARSFFHQLRADLRATVGPRHVGLGARFVD